MFAGHPLHRYMLLIIFLVGLPAGVSADGQNIHAVRSAYLFYFSHFIQWPTDTRFKDDVFTLCAMVDNPNDRFQLSTIDGKALGEQQLAIRFASADQSGDSLNDCHMLYVNQAYADWLAQEAGKLDDGVLLVTEGEVSTRGAIHLFIEDNKLKFDINNRRLSSKNFKASSKLLRLSKKAEA